MNPNRYFPRMGTAKHLLPVIHVIDRDQALRSAAIADKAGCMGAFLITHGYLSPEELIEVYCAVRQQLRAWHLGLNLLMSDPLEALALMPRDVDWAWIDDAGIVEDTDAQMRAEQIRAAVCQPGFSPLLFGGVDFKYRPPAKDAAAAARVAAPLMDVVTTSGPATGQPADLDKVVAMRQAMGGAPLALASGVDIDNAASYQPYVNCFLVASSITDPATEILDYELTRRLRVIIEQH